MGPKLTTEQKQQQIAALEQKLIQLKQIRDSLTRHSEEWEKARIAVINVQVRIRSINKSIEHINNFDPTSTIRKYKFEKKRRYEEFVKEKEREIEALEAADKIEKAKKWRELLEICKLRYKYSMV